jgi:hypothetical protein
VIQPTRRSWCCAECAAGVLDTAAAWFQQIFYSTGNMGQVCCSCDKGGTAVAWCHPIACALILCVQERS